MFRKILLNIGFFLLILLFVAYMTTAWFLDEKAGTEEVCKDFTVRIKDSGTDRFVTEDQVLELIEKHAADMKGSPVREADLTSLESMLEGKIAIKESNASVSRKGTVNVTVTQRKPVIRFQCQNGGFYSDETGYLFPLAPTFSSDVPIVTGNLPVNPTGKHRGHLKGKDSIWISDMVKIAEYMGHNPFWNSQIQQMFVMQNGDIIMFPRVGGQKIIFGTADMIGEKFAKLDVFYRKVMPVHGWNRYSTINLKYRNQIICE